jgi:hypothetical protein
MDDNWYYAESADSSYGPMTIEELGRALRGKANSFDFLVWRPGMTNWGRAGDQFPLSKYFQPPPLARHQGLASERLVIDRDDRPVIAEQATPQLHPWRRYFARMFDLYLFYLFFFLFLGIVLPSLFANSDKSTGIVYSVIGAVAYAVFEGFCLHVFGTSLGKKLYGIKVVRADKDGFVLPISFKRSFAVWIRGLGLGIPIAAFVTLIVAYQTLSREGQTSWDRDFQCSVTHSKLSALRWIWIVSVWLAILAIYFSLSALART